MQVNPKIKKALSLLLVLCMMLQYVPMASFAADVDNFCEHHPEYTAECGYAEGEVDCTYYCDVCLGRKEPSDLEKDVGVIHDHEYVTDVTAPTCTKQGYTTYTCACGDSYVDDYMDPRKHSYENGICAFCQTVSPLYGKNVSILGDSISTFSGVSKCSSPYYNGSNLDVQSVNDTWWGKLIEDHGMKLCVNYSQGGVAMYDSVIYNNRVLKLHTDNSSPDIIFVFLGHNDKLEQVKPFEDVRWDTIIQENADGTYTYATPDSFTEAYVVAVHKMLNEYPAAQVVLLRCLTTGTSQKYNQINPIIQAIGDKFSLTVVDFYGNGLCRENKTYFPSDVHPNKAGMMKITDILVQALGNMHVHKFNYVVTAPTCTEQGYTTYNCTCGESYVDDYTVVAEHTYENGICGTCGHTIGPVITKQPVDTEAKLGQRYVVEVEAKGEGLKYQWYIRNKGANSFSKSSVKDNTYDNVMTEARAGREIYCVVTDVNGNSVTTDTVKLICSPSVSLAITTQPTDSVAKLGERYCVTVEATGEGLEYQWYIRNAGTKNFSKSSVKGNTYDNVMTKARAGREVYCVVTDAFGNKVTTETAKLVCPVEELSVMTQPTDSAAKLGEHYCVTVEATGEGLEYQWYIRNVGSSVWSKSSVKDNTYDNVMTKARAGREVYCVVTDAFGNKVTTDVAKLVLIE